MKPVKSLNWRAGMAMASIFTVASTSLAAGGLNEAVGHPVKSREKAERLPVGSRATLAYATCKTIWITEVDKERGMVVLAQEAAKSARKTKKNVDTNAVILKGYDAVAYFTRHQVIKGSPAIHSSYGGAIYHFSSVADKAAFDKNPSRYVPQYGGFCAWNMSKGKLIDSDPTVFSVYKSKLYVCADPEALQEFRSDIDKNIRQADERWFTYHFGWHGHPGF